MRYPACMSKPEDTPSTRADFGAALLEFTCRFATVMVDKGLMDGAEAGEMLQGIERAMATGRQDPATLIALQNALERSAGNSIN